MNSAQLLEPFPNSIRGSSRGRGSLGNVFQALDQGTGQLFAVKEAVQCIRMQIGRAHV